MNVMKKVMLAAALTCSGAGAFADTTIATLSFSTSLAGSSFNNEFDFTLPSAATLKSFLTVSGDIWGGASLYEVGNPTALTTVSLNDGTSSVLAPLGAGSYFYKLVGGTTGPGAYTAVLSTVSAVPEPANIAMMLAGVGVLGFIARRRNNNG